MGQNTVEIVHAIVDKNITQSFLLWLYSLANQFYTIVHDYAFVQLDKNSIGRNERKKCDYSE